MKIPANTPDDVRVFVIDYLQHFASARRRDATRARTKFSSNALAKAAEDIEFLARQLNTSSIVTKG